MFKDITGQFHITKAVYTKYLGWYDGNPANLNPLPPVEAGKKYVEYMGGTSELIEKATKAFERVITGG